MEPEDVLLGAGYAVAVPGTLLLLRICWRRWVGAFLALEAGTAAISAGWFLRGERVPGWFNAGAGVGFLATWIAVGRVRRRRLGEDG